MASIQNDVRRFASMNTSFTSGVTAASSGKLSPVSTINTYQANIYRTVYSLENLDFSVTTGAGGANDGQGQKVGSLPEGGIKILGAHISGTVTTPAGTSAATAVISLGTAAADDSSATLTSTEADILASAALGDGTLAAAASETISVFGEPVGNNAANSGLTVLDGSATAKDLYLNIAGVWTHATVTPQLIRLSNVKVVLLWTWIGDD